MKFLSFLIKRVVYGIIMLLALITMVFMMLHLAPGISSIPWPGKWAAFPKK